MAALDAGGSHYNPADATGKDHPVSPPLDSWVKYFPLVFYPGICTYLPETIVPVQGAFITIPETGEATGTAGLFQ
jgi:hypothetical protein